jgi:hypothetical protein
VRLKAILQVFSFLSSAAEARPAVVARGCVVGLVESERVTTVDGVVCVVRSKKVRNSVQESCDSNVGGLLSALLVVSVLNQALSVTKTTFKVMD